MELLDIHTHHIPTMPGTALYCLNEGEQLPAGQLCSAGIHPWNVTQDYLRQCEWVREAAAASDVLAIGEIGLDRHRGPDIDLQIAAFRHQIAISEELGKPVILHVVKENGLLLSVRKELKPSMPWLLHGFRGSPQLALQLLAHGIMVSFGEHFNPDTLSAVGADRLLIETDEALDVNEILNRTAACLNVPPASLRRAAALNAQRFLNIELH